MSQVALGGYSSAASKAGGAGSSSALFKRASTAAAAPSASAAVPAGDTFAELDAPELLTALALRQGEVDCLLRADVRAALSERARERRERRGAPERDGRESACASLPKCLRC